GLIKTKAGLVKTPTFMPDGTRGAVKGLTASQVVSTGVQTVLANTYHLHLRPGENIIARLGGLHSFTRQTLPILTDSGGFQVFSLSKIRKITEEGVEFRDPLTGNKNLLTPESSMQIQLKLGADMMVAFDDVTALDDEGKSRTKEAFERTHRWLERSLAEFQRLTKNMKPSERPLLFGVVQGGLSKKLRKSSLEVVQSLPVDGIAIGGLSVGEPRKDMYEMLKYLAPMYDPARPHFLLGVGEPADLRLAIEQGVDMFDCVLPTRNARHGTAWVRGDKKIHLSNAKFIQDNKPIDPSCDCTTCKEGYSRGFLRHQFKVGESLAGSLVSIHNIRYLQRICEDYRK
ncbi:MAG TPA: tRNA guanosine(34) transglycosylase Tgt, partial [Patescibacteria group bacterium]|nr:tRNA guanosine(34) transglycosylase Tgt [Patescibacteria group bacterium]